jgi:hypothetical protein
MVTTIQSACECQSKLFAELDERRNVVRGWAKDKTARVNVAPAHSIGAHGSLFQVAWQCPFCTRNQLRSFDAGAFTSPAT